jgi:hypothetical protein
MLDTVLPVLFVVVNSWARQEIGLTAVSTERESVSSRLSETVEVSSTMALRARSKEAGAHQPRVLFGRRLTHWGQALR